MGIDMNKRVESAGVSLQKVMAEADAKGVDMSDVSCQVDIAVDFSYSMTPYYPTLVQEVVENALAISLTGLDDDGEVPVIFYDSQVYDEIVAKQGTYNGLVGDFMSRHSMGGTAYAGPLTKMLKKSKKMFGGSDETKSAPRLHIFVTDGEPGDKPATEKLLISGRERPHFFQFIVVGNDLDAKRYIEHLNNDLTGPGIDNVGASYYSDLQNVTPEKFAEDVLREFLTEWLPKARQAKYTA